jgi:hypothetical protein
MKIIIKKIEIKRFLSGAYFISISTNKSNLKKDGKIANLINIDVFMYNEKIKHFADGNYSYMSTTCFKDKNNAQKALEWLESKIMAEVLQNNLVISNK